VATETTDKSGEARTNSDADEKLLKQIREDFAYHRSYWHDNYEESSKDMDCVAAKPPKDFTDDREGRPCIWPDETTQYINSANNNLRQSPRSIKLSPREGATDEDAEHRQAYIRGIEDASKGASIYTTGYESAVQCAFGFWRLTTVITGPKGEQEPRLKRIPNWATVFPDPECLEADFSDQDVCFVIDSMRESKFARKYPKAQKRSFTSEDRVVAPDFLNGGNVVVAEYWTRECEETEDGEKTYKVTQRITNGVEILETHEWLGSWIPIIGVFGKEIYIKDGGQSKRLFLSMIRTGRPAQQMMAYIASQEAEEFGQMPRASWVGWENQFAHAAETWDVAHRTPISRLEAKVPTDWNSQWGPPQLPTRPQFMPNPNPYEMAYERWRRSHQAAVAGSPLPTDAQKVNDKSGIALEKITDAGMLGNFHFTDNFARALCNTGEQINELITKLAETDSLPKELLGKDQKGEDLKLTVAGKDFVVPPESSEHLPEANYFFAHRGKFTVTISDGASKQSERDDQAELADKIFETVEGLAQILPPGAVAKILAIAIKMKNLGAMGDELVDVIDPKDNTGQQLQQAQQQIQAAQQAAQEMQAEIQKLKLERAGKVIENEYKSQAKDKELTVMQAIAQLNADLKMYIANVATKAQSVSERERLFQETQIENHHAAHDAGLQASDQAHERDMATRAAAVQQAAQVADQQHQQTMATQPEPDVQG
jgi:hypothetical protein